MSHGRKTFLPITTLENSHFSEVIVPLFNASRDYVREYKLLHISLIFYKTSPLLYPSVYLECGFCFLATKC